MDDGFTQNNPLSMLTSDPLSAKSPRIVFKVELIISILYINLNQQSPRHRLIADIIIIACVLLIWWLIGLSLEVLLCEAS